MTELRLEDYKPTFRPDIQALRALAVVLVVLFHASIPGIHGGYLGVDVFFVISGFVITGVLLHERVATNGTSILDFYGRRIRRILPAATVTIILTIFATYHWLAFISGDKVANDAKWVTAFLGNFHFATTGTQYFGATDPPSTLTQFWSLAVEEQFYLVWPLLFLGLAALLPKRFARTSLLAGLGTIIAGSLFFSVVQTSSNPVQAFYSPFTRAWQLGLGALLAVLTPVLKDKAPKLGVWFGLVGCAVIGVCTWMYTSQTAASSWPGWRAAVPVAATGLVIAGGTLRQSSGFGFLTNFRVIQWFGAISFSLYLVHYPILQIAVQHGFGQALSTTTNLELVALSVAVAAVSFYAVEQPFRKFKFFLNRRWATYVLGALLIAASYAAIYWHLHNNGAI
ncbi:MAG: acyltransferase [Actinomycetota bacterium]